MAVTQRDKDILQFINEFGFCLMPYLDKHFGFKKPNNYNIVKRLIQNNFVIYERIFHLKHGTYRLSKKGATYSESDLRPLLRIPIPQYRHNLLIIDVYLKLLQKYPDAIWQSERRLKQERFKMFRDKKKFHLPDGLLNLSDKYKVAIEVELSQKGTERLKKILRGYTLQTDIQEVWYFCDEKTLSHMSALTEKMPLIKLFSLKDFLDDARN